MTSKATVWGKDGRNYEIKRDWDISKETLSTSKVTIDQKVKMGVCVSC